MSCDAHPSPTVRYAKDGAPSEWDKTPPSPGLPETIVRDTAAKYQDVVRRLTA